MQVASSIVSTFMSAPVWAIVPIKGGSAPTIAPIRVFVGDFYFIGMYMQRYVNQTVLEITHVNGSNIVQVATDINPRPVPMKHPFLELIFPFGMGLF